MKSQAPFIVDNSFSEFLSIAEVATVAEARDDVFVLVHAGVDGGAPEGGIFGKRLVEHFDAFGYGDDTCHVNGAWFARLDESLVACGHRTTCCQHGVGDDKRATFHAGSRHVFGVNAHLGVFAIGVHAIGRHEGAGSVVEDIEESLVEGKSGA